MKKFSEIQSSHLFTDELPGDSSIENKPRKVEHSCYSLVKPTEPIDPYLIHYSKAFAKEIDIEMDHQSYFTSILSGKESMLSAKPYAMCYGGHQFGHWAGQLGDGRAINIAEIKTNKRWILQLKGAGPTPYSRKGDGYAVLRSSIREYLCSEAMHHLGVPTTRALSLIKTGNKVLRDILYNGNAAYEQGAIVCRVSESFLRFGNFELFAARQDLKSLKALTDFTIKHHFPELGKPSKQSYIAFFKEVAKRTKNLMIHWQRVGFVHGVMNTDNLSILGLTIDYGPYGWLENYDPNWTPNTTDAQHKRYRYEQQPSIALWNLLQLANALYPLIEQAEPLEAVLKSYERNYKIDYHKMMLSKLGLLDVKTDHGLILDLNVLMESSKVDYTLFYRLLCSEGLNDFSNLWLRIEESSYLKKDLLDLGKEKWKKWFIQYSECLVKEGRSEKERVEEMRKLNPKYVLRNYMAQLAIEDAEKGNYGLIEELYNLLLNPYKEQPAHKKWFAKRPDWAEGKVGCGMLSCSS